MTFKWTCLLSLGVAVAGCGEFESVSLPDVSQDNYAEFRDIICLVSQEIPKAVEAYESAIPTTVPESKRRFPYPAAAVDLQLKVVETASASGIPTLRVPVGPNSITFSGSLTSASTGTRTMTIKYSMRLTGSPGCKGDDGAEENRIAAPNNAGEFGIEEWMREIGTLTALTNEPPQSATYVVKFDLANPGRLSANFADADEGSFQLVTDPRVQLSQQLTIAFKTIGESRPLEVFVVNQPSGDVQDSERLSVPQSEVTLDSLTAPAFDEIDRVLERLSD